MPAKKAKKMASKDECDCSCHKSNIKSWFLILLGAVGLLNAMYIISLGMWSMYFQYVWSIIVLLLGMTMLMIDSC